MKKLSILLLATTLSLNTTHAQLTIKVTSLPMGAPPNTTLFIAGNFNNWNPGDSTKILTKRPDATYAISITPPNGLVEFKFTRGTWASNEGDASGGFQPNHQFNYTGKPDSINIPILSWQDVSTVSHTAAPNVRILDEAFNIPQLNRTRRIWIYLPPDYDAAQTKRYPVLYMHDAQNLFDKATSFAGEWQVDETLNTLFTQGDKGCIVVGIDNGGSHRLDEYSPWTNTKYGGGEGAKYTDFLVNTLKPHIDSLFRTKPDRENTAIAGSSMGGLISLYAAIQYQNTFSKAGIFSPSLWFSDQSFEQVRQQGKQKPMRIYLVAGQNEENLSGGTDSNAVNLQKMYDLLKSKGFPPSDLNLQIKPDGQHAEWFWAREFPATYQWLFSSTATTTKNLLATISVKIYPNPADSILNIETDPAENYINIEIYDLYGRLMAIQPLKQKQIDVSFLKSGTYIITGTRANAIIFSNKTLIGR